MQLWQGFHGCLIGHQLMGWLFSLSSIGRLCSRGLREEGGHHQGGHYQGGHHQGVQHHHGHHGLKESVCHFGWLTCRGAVGVSASGLPAGKTWWEKHKFDCFFEPETQTTVSRRKLPCTLSRTWWRSLPTSTAASQRSAASSGPAQNVGGENVDTQWQLEIKQNKDNK